MEQPLPKPPQEPQEPPKKRRRALPWVFLGIAVLLLLLVGASGLYTIPGVSHLFGTNKPIDLGIQASPEALASANEKLNNNLIGSTDDYTLFANKEYGGSVDVEQDVTSEELTSFAQAYIPESEGLFTDLQLKVIDGGMEISAHVVPYVNAPVYIKGGITKASAKSIDLDIQNVKLGRLPIPGTYLDDIETFAEEVINDRMAEVDGFTIETLEFRNGAIHFTGTHPEMKTMTNGNWFEK